MRYSIKYRPLYIVIAYVLNKYKKKQSLKISPLNKKHLLEIQSRYKQKILNTRFL